MLTGTESKSLILGTFALLIGLGAASGPAIAEQASNGATFRAVKFQGRSLQGQNLEGRWVHSDMVFDGSAVTIAEVRGKP
jgi:hypothetical protein